MNFLNIFYLYSLIGTAIKSVIDVAGGGSITDSYEDISMDEDEIQDNDSSTADRNSKPNQLGSIDSEPESIPNVDDVTGNSDLLENKIRAESEYAIGDHDVSIMTNIENDKSNPENKHEKKNPSQSIDITDENEEITVDYKSLPIDVMVDNEPIKAPIEEESIVNAFVEKKPSDVIIDNEHVHSNPHNEEELDNKTISDSGQNDAIGDNQEIGDVGIINEISNNNEEEETSEIIDHDYSNEINVSETRDNLINADAVNINQMMIYENVGGILEEKNKAIVEISVSGNDGTKKPAEFHTVQIHTVEVNTVDIVETNFRTSSNETIQPEPEKLRKVSSERSTTRRPIRHYSSSRRMWSEMPEVCNHYWIF